MVEYVIPRPYVDTTNHADAEIQRLRLQLDELQRFAGDMHSTYDYTQRGYPTEDDAVNTLRDFVQGGSAFVMHEKVAGRYLSMRPEQDLSYPIIDAILEPTPRLLAQGWPHGFIGVECKKSGVAVGAPLLQAMDYKQAVFNIRGDSYTYMNYVLLWPWLPYGGPVLSFCAQLRIGGAGFSNGALIMASATQLARVTEDGDVTFNGNKAGKRKGSR